MNKEFTLYGGEVTGLFRPEERYRYVITDPVKGLKDKKVRGVTTVLGDILDKPGLRLWARDEMAKVAFGMELVDGKATYSEKQSLLKVGIEYGKEHYQEILDKSFNAYTTKTNRGKDIGTMVHDMVARYLTGEEVSPSTITTLYPEAEEEHVKCVVKALRGFVEWWNSIIDKEVLGVENVIYSREHQFSGTYDLKVKINGKVFMLDIKTTNKSLSAPLGIYPEYFMQLGGYMLADKEGSGQKFDDCGIINVGKDGRVNIVTASDVNMTVEECEISFKYAIKIHDWLEKVKKLTEDSHFVSKLSKPNAEVEASISLKVRELIK